MRFVLAVSSVFPFRASAAQHFSQRGPSRYALIPLLPESGFWMAPAGEVADKETDTEQKQGGRVGF